MAQFTQADLIASEQYAHLNWTIRVIQRLAQPYPHIATHLEIEMLDTVPYYVPEVLKPYAKTIKVNFTETLCNAVSCMPMKERGPCQENEPASYYYVGDDAIDVQCQPACFNLAAVKNHNASGVRAPDMPYLVWNKAQRKCRYANTGIVTWLEKSFYRSEKRYSMRENNLHTGFSRIENYGNPDGTNRSYRINAAYCGYFDLEYKPPESADAPTTAECFETEWMKVVGVLVGTALINTVKGGYRFLTSEPMLPKPKNLPTLPDTLRPEHTVAGWKQNINPNFVVPTVIGPNATKRPSGNDDDRNASSSKRKKRSLSPSASSTASQQQSELNNYHQHNQTEAHRMREQLERRHLFGHDESSSTTPPSDDQVKASITSSFMRHYLGLPPLPDQDSTNTRDTTAADLANTEQSSGHKRHKRADDANTGQAEHTDDLKRHKRDVAADHANTEQSSGQADHTDDHKRHKRDAEADIANAEALAGLTEDLRQFWANLPTTTRQIIDDLPYQLRAFGLTLLRTGMELIHSLGDPEVLKAIGIDLLASIALAGLKKLGRHLAERMSLLLTKSLAKKIGTKIGEKVLSAGITSVMRTVVVRFGTQMLARGTLLLSRMLVAATSVVGWLLLGAMLLDLIFQLWDPLGYNKMLPPKLPGDMMEMGERTLRRELGVTHADFELASLAQILLGPDELIAITFESIIDRFVYLDSLTVNSEGSRIDKGADISIPQEDVIDGGKQDALSMVHAAAFAQQLRFDSGSFADDGWRLQQRLRLNTQLNKGAKWALVGSLGVLIVRQHLLSILVLVGAIILLALARLSVHSDILVDLLAKYTNKAYDDDFRIAHGGANAGFAASFERNQRCKLEIMDECCDMTSVQQCEPHTSESSSVVLVSVGSIFAVVFSYLVIKLATESTRTRYTRQHRSTQTVRRPRSPRFSAVLSASSRHTVAPVRPSIIRKPGKKKHNRRVTFADPLIVGSSSKFFVGHA